MKDKTKKRLILAGAGVLCVVLIAGIAIRMQRPPSEDNIQTPSGQLAGEVSPNADLDPDPSVNPAESTPVEPVVKIQTPDPAESSVPAGDSTGTDQTIQGDVTEPEYDEEKLKDPTKTPDGQAVSQPPQNVDHDNVTPPSNPPAKPDEPQSSDKNDKGQIYIPGFGWVNETGGTGKTGDSDGDINKQVGIMGGGE